MSAPVALTVFRQLCEVGHLLEQWRDQYAPGADEWVAMTDILAAVDLAVGTLVDSQGLGGRDDG